MSNPESTSPTSAPPPASPRRRFIRSAAIGTVIAAVAAGIGWKAAAFGHGRGGWHRGGLMGAALDPARLDERLDHMLRHLYVEVDATDAQKQQLGPIVKGAVRDLLPLHERIHEARSQAVALLSQPTVDRAALEALRAGQVQVWEQASRRLTQVLADVADVLTPEQRKQLAERAARWRGHHG